MKENYVWWLTGAFIGLIAVAVLSVFTAITPASIFNKITNQKNLTQDPKAVSKNNKTITFITTNSPNTYYLSSNQQYAGLEYDLIRLFMHELGDEYSLNLKVVDDFAQVIPALEDGNTMQIGAADISITEARKSVVQFSESYYQVQQQVSYNRDKTTVVPRKIEAIGDQKITVPAGTSFVERLEKLGAKNDLTWEVRADTSSEILLEAVANGEIDYTIADNHLLAIMQYYYPNLGMAFSIGEPEKIAWAMPKNVNAQLKKQVTQFFKKIKANGTLHNLVDRYHGNTKRLNPFDVKSILVKSQTLLPKYARLFKEAQEITDVDWRLLAAISYQESHWDTFNTSPTNVRGLMMLTEDTSDLMKVSDRLDPKQSIPAGAKFFLWLKERFPERMQDPDRTYMALASYNIGFGHVEDARVLAQRLKLNPDRWADVKKALLLLTEPKYYSKAKHGFCNCGAPVVYTEYIRSYFQVLEKHQPIHNPSLDAFRIASN